MGSIFSTSRPTPIVSRFPTNTLMFGLDAAGKTTILYRLKLGKVVATDFTIGPVQTITHHNFAFTIWDTWSGSIPYLWRHCFQDIIGVIFVVDSNDARRVIQVKEQLWRAHDELNNAGLRNTPLLIYANKQDLRWAMTVAEIRDALDLANVRGREWHIQGVCALDGEGLKEGLDWYATQVARAARNT